MVVGPDGVERTKNEHKKFMKKQEKATKKEAHKATKVGEEST